MNAAQRGNSVPAQSLVWFPSSFSSAFKFCVAWKEGEEEEDEEDEEDEDEDEDEAQEAPASL